MTVTVQSATFDPDTETAPSRATLDTTAPVEVPTDLAWLLAQAWIAAPLFP
jgi:hypothetical protein